MYFYLYLSTVDCPVDGRDHMEMPIKTEPSACPKLNISSDIIVINSDSDSDSVSEHSEKSVPPSNTKTIPETPTDDQSNDTELDSGN